MDNKADLTHISGHYKCWHVI